MKKYSSYVIFVFLLALPGLAQTNLWSSYKYTDGIHLAPSLTGYRGGAVVVNYRSSLSKVAGAPKSGLIVAHTSILQEKAGVGIVISQESNNVLEYLQIQIPLAYHLKMNQKQGFSFGLAPQIIQSRLNTNDITNKDISSDSYLQNYDNTTQLDFNVSAQLNHKYYEVGISVDRIRSYSDNSLPAAISLYSNVYIPIKDDYDLLEPSIIISRDNNGDWLGIAYLYYKFIDKIIVGGGYQTNKNILLSAGYSYDNRIIIGYNFETHLETKALNLGNTHEISLRFNLNQRYYNQRKYSIFSRPIRSMSKY